MVMFLKKVCEGTQHPVKLVFNGLWTTMELYGTKAMDAHKIIFTLGLVFTWDLFIMRKYKMS